MKILTWNINGIRAVTGKSGVGHLLKSLDADVVCLQETKVTRDMLDEPTAIVDGFESYFSFSRKRTGYSGTANYCATSSTPVGAEEGLTGNLSGNIENIVGCYGNLCGYPEKELEALDAEGRCVITQHKIRLGDGKEREVAIINVYVPRAGDRVERRDYKLKFLTLLRNRARALLRKKRHVIILGDLNLTHTALDNCDPKSDPDFLHRASRVWINNMLRPAERDSSISSSHLDLDEVLLSSDVEEDTESEEERDRKSQTKTTDYGKRDKAQRNDPHNLFRLETEDYSFSDVYRRLHPNEACGYTNWSTSTDARKSNFGRRLDYILVDAALANYVTDCQILTEVMGSDHCPVVVTFSCQALPSTQSTPQLCARLMPEFRGKQQKLSSFFNKALPNSNPPSSPISALSQSSSSSSSQEDVRSTLPLKKSNSAPHTSSFPQKKVNLKRNLSTKMSNSKSPPKKAKQASLATFFAPKQTIAIDAADKGSATRISLAVQKDKSNEPLQDRVILEEDERTASAEHILKEDNSFDKDTKPGTADEVNAHHSLLTLSNQMPSVKTDCSQNCSSRPELSSKTPKQAANSWKALLSGPAPPPLCPGHKEPCALKTVRKNGPNKNKQFYSCSRPDGPPGNSQYRCNFFLWYHEHQKSKKS